MVNSYKNSKMAEGRRENVCRDLRGMGRARVLLWEIEDFRRRREEDQGSSSHLQASKGVGLGPRGN